MRRLTGRHVLIIAISAFGLVIAANMAMLLAATGTFPGLVVKNSYVASQGWNRRAAAQQALGWKAAFSYAPGRVTLTLRDRHGQPVRKADLVLTVGRPTHEGEDRRVVPRATADGYLFEVVLAPGQWRLDLRTKGGPAYRISADLLVRGDR